MASACGLTPDEGEQLAQLSASQVHFFAESLAQKRLCEVGKLLPLCSLFLGEQFPALFFRYASGFVPSGIKKHLEDAIAFAGYLERAAREENLGPRWLADLARYEAGWLLASSGGRRWKLRGFRYGITAVLTCAAQGGGGAVPPELPSFALWFRLGRRMRLRHLVLSLPLRLCAIAKRLGIFRPNAVGQPC